MHQLIESYIRAGFAGLYLVTHEEVRAERDLGTAAASLGYGLHTWSVTSGLLNVQSGAARRELTDPVEAVNAVADLPERTILVLRDFHQFLGDASQPASPLVTRSLKDRLRECRGGNKVILVTACLQRLPPELGPGLQDSLVELARRAGLHPQLNHAGPTLEEGRDLCREGEFGPEVGVGDAVQPSDVPDVHGPGHKPRPEWRGKARQDQAGV